MTNSESKQVDCGTDGAVGVWERLRREARAQDLVEYGVALSVIALGAALAAIAVAGGVNAMWSAANSIITQVAV